MEASFSASSLENGFSSVTSGEEVLYDLLFGDAKEAATSASGQSSLLNLEKQKQLDASFQYLRELNSYHIDRLQVEPSQLAESKQHIQEEIKNLAFSNYKTFIRTAQCSREIYADFSIIDAKLDTLITKLPEFGSMCESFTKNIQTINGSRRANNLTLQKHNQLLEMLEISQLMDTCVRNEYYDEALDLANYVKRLDKKFSSSIPLIQHIVSDVNRSLNLMLKQLLQQLRTNLQFPQCLKIIAIINRLDVFSENELRIKFLQLRDSWLQSLLNAIPTSDPYHHISKTIEENRVHLFDIITQYRAIFSDEEAFGSAPGSVVVNAAGYVNSWSALLSQKGSNEAKLFICWLQQKIKNFLSVLRADLKQGVGNRLDSVLSQAMYFGLAFSRVGLDFRALMVPIFEQAALEQMTASLDKANVKFHESLVKVNWSDLYLENSKASTSASSTLDPNPLDQERKASSGIVSAPMCLIDFHPLAIYLNSVLQAFNELRLCAPLNIFQKVSHQVQESLGKLCSQFEAYYKKEKSSFDSNETELVKTFLSHLAYELIPFLERCLNTVFSVDQLKTNLCIPQSEMAKLKDSLKLDSSAILKSIQDLVPPPPKPAPKPVEVVVITPIAEAVQEETEPAVEEQPEDKVDEEAKLDQQEPAKED